MTVSDQINAFIEKEGNGNVRDALNVALFRLEQKENPLIAELERQNITQEEFLTWLKSDSVFNSLKESLKVPIVKEDDSDVELYTFLVHLQNKLPKKHQRF